MNLPTHAPGDPDPEDRSPILPADSPDLDFDRIEEYLDRICAPLVGQVPYRRRQELRAEVREHLVALAVAERARGAGAFDSVSSALCAFGKPGLFARRWLREWRPETPPSFWKALAAAAVLMAAACLAFASMFFDPDSFGFGSGSPFTAFSLGLVICLGLGTPILAGVSIGLHVGRRSALFVLYSFFLVFLLSEGIGLFISPPPLGPNSPAIDIIRAAEIVVVLPIVLLSAWLGVPLKHAIERIRLDRVRSAIPWRAA